MFIMTENTPNPQAMKFLPGRPVLPSGTLEFTSLEAAKGKSPLAAVLLEMEEVRSVFLGQDFITVTKTESSDWNVAKPLVLTTIMEHFVTGKPVTLEEGENKTITSHEGEDEVSRQIRELIETRVRPAVAQDGGDIVFREFKDGVVKLELYGSCSGCPSSTMTLKSGIENMLKHYVPEVVSVEQVMA